MLGVGCWSAENARSLVLEVFVLAWSWVLELWGGLELGVEALKCAQLLRPGSQNLESHGATLATIDEKASLLPATLSCSRNALRDSENKLLSKCSRTACIAAVQERLPNDLISHHNARGLEMSQNNFQNS